MQVVSIGNRRACANKHTAFNRLVCLLVVLAFVARFCALAYRSYDLPFQLLGIAVSFASAALVVRQSKLRNFEYAYILIIFGILLAQGVYTIGYLGQTFFHFFSAAYSYSFCLILLPCAYLFDELDGSKLLDSLQVVSIGFAAFMLISAVLKNNYGISLIEAIRERGGNARFGEPEIVDLMVVYSSWKIGSGRGTTVDSLCLVSGTLAVFFVSQSRAIEAILLLSCYAMLVLCVKGADKKALLICAGYFILLLATTTGVISSFANSFSVVGDEAASTIARIDEVSYYLDAFVANPLMGIGMIARESPLKYLVGGVYGNYYPEDVGIVGALGTIGLLVIPLYVVPLFAFIHEATRAQRSVKSLYYGLIIFLLGTSATLLIAYPFCSPAWPFLMSLIFHYKPNYNRGIVSS